MLNISYFVFYDGFFLLEYDSSEDKTKNFGIKHHIKLEIIYGGLRA